MCVEGSQSAMHSSSVSPPPPALDLGRAGPPPAESGGFAVCNGALGVGAAPGTPPDPVIDGNEPGGGSGTAPGGA